MTAKIVDVLRQALIELSEVNERFPSNARALAIYNLRTIITELEAEQARTLDVLRQVRSDLLYGFCCAPLKKIEELITELDTKA